MSEAGHDIFIEHPTECIHSTTRLAKTHHTAHSERWEAIDKVKNLNNGKLELTHFRKLKRIGVGGSATVFLAELKNTKTYFAVKVENINGWNTWRVQKEIEILERLDHPLLPTLFFHCETKDKSFTVIEYCAGGDLNRLRRKQPGRCFPEEIARFYCAEILLALEYLHMLGIVYRDLKPENVLVRDDGHLMLTDFNLSKAFGVDPRVTGIERPKSFYKKYMRSSYIRTFFSSRNKEEKKKTAKVEIEFVAEPWCGLSRSTVGTHEYMAPEIVQQRGHGNAVDWWTLGVFLYKLLYGITPFKGKDKDETLDNIVNKDLSFLETPDVSGLAKDLIRRLLVKDPLKRLGRNTGAAEIKKHPFFEGIQWALVLSRPPPNLPKPACKKSIHHSHKGNLEKKEF